MITPLGFVYKKYVSFHDPYDDSEEAELYVDALAEEIQYRIDLDIHAEALRLTGE